MIYFPAYRQAGFRTGGKEIFDNQRVVLGVVTESPGKSVTLIILKKQIMI